MTAPSILISPEWQALNLDGISGVLLVIGAPDSGKSTFARFLFHRLKDLGRSAAFIDGDPGQSALGPPTTLTLTFDPDRLYRDSNSLVRVWRYFIGSTTPQRHMLPILVGAARLTQTAYQIGAQVVIYDTCGLVDPRRGGLALKNAKLDLLCPTTVFAIQRQGELEPFLLPLCRSGRARVIELRPSNAVVHRDIDVRREHRRHQFVSYFAQAGAVDVMWSRLAVFPNPDFRLHRLVALEDLSGFTLGLGIVLSINRPAQRIRLLTPLRALAGVAAIRLGDVLVNPDDYHDMQIMG